MLNSNGLPPRSLHFVEEIHGPAKYDSIVLVLEMNDAKAFNFFPSYLGNELYQSLISFKAILKAFVQPILCINSENPISTTNLCQGAHGTS
jgi:hypothetical protein